MTVCPQFFHDFSAQLLAFVLNLCHQKKRPAKRLQRFNGPEHNRQLGVSIMPLNPDNALIVFLQGRRA